MNNLTKLSLLLLTGFLAISSAQAQTVFTGTASGNTDNWNVSGNWDTGIPTGTDSAVISTGSSAVADNGATPTYSGGLNLQDNSSLKIIDDNDLGALGSSTVSLGAGASLDFRGIGGETISNAFTLTGNGAAVSVGESTASAGTVIFNGGFSGAFAFEIAGNNNSRARFTTSNGFSSLTTLGNRGFNDANFVLEANAAGSLGLGDVTILDTDTLLINATNAFGSGAILTLTGASANKTGANSKLFLNVDATVSGLIVDGVPQAAGIYDNAASFLGGSGTLIVLPEPSSFALMGLGLGALYLLRRRR